MKKKLFLCIISFLCFFATSEIVSWKGMELGAEKSPSWLTRYVNKKDETYLRKKFDLDEDEIIFCASSESESLEAARYIAEMKCRREMLDYRQKFNKEMVGQRVSGMESLTEYWEHNSGGIYTIYVFYTMRKKVLK